MQHEPFARKVLLEGMKRRMAIPAQFQDPPQAIFGTDIFFQAFTELSEEREQAPGSLFPIRARDIRDWAARAGYAHDLDFLDELTSHVRAMDAVWMEVVAANRRSAEEKAERERSAQAARLHGGRT